METFNGDISTDIGAGIRSDIDAEFDTQSTVIANARKLVALGDAAVAALPAARARHAALVRQQVLANAANDRALDDLWPLLATVVGFDVRVDAARAMAWKANEVAMNEMRKVGGDAMVAGDEVSRLEKVVSGKAASEARRIVEAADDQVVLRTLVGLTTADTYIIRRVL
jgi:hypothetical protein